MNKKSKVEKVFEKLLCEYTNKYNVNIMLDEETSYCYVGTKEIYYSVDEFLAADINSLFTFLHEVGHLETNNLQMKRCEMEFYATQWASDKLHEYNLIVPDEIKIRYQEYIWSWRNRFLSRSKNMPTLEELSVNW